MPRWRLVGPKPRPISPQARPATGRMTAAAELLEGDALFGDWRRLAEMPQHPGRPQMEDAVERDPHRPELLKDRGLAVPRRRRTLHSHLPPSRRA
ncbi:Monooxygenase (fragment) [Mesorhizobium sp. ORS 3324]